MIPKKGVRAQTVVRVKGSGVADDVPSNCWQLTSEIEGM